MKYKHAKYNFLLNKITQKDHLFNGDYTTDPYQNCEYSCIYCDSTYDETIYIKINAAQLLAEELEKNKKGTIIVGYTVDPYQKAEKKHQITRNLLKIIRQNGFNCHILTKSKLVLRDIDVLSKIRNCIVTITLITLNEKTSEVFEKNTPSPIDRLQTLEKLSDNNIKTGVAVIPVLPFITEKELGNIVKLSKEYKAQYVLHKHLELKGDQKKIFIKTIEKSYPHLAKKYEKLYVDSYKPDNNYVTKINNIMNKWCTRYNIENKIKMSET